jgi:hypothetical protein
MCISILPAILTMFSLHMQVGYIRIMKRAVVAYRACVAKGATTVRDL